VVFPRLFVLPQSIIVSLLKFIFQISVHYFCNARKPQKNRKNPINTISYTSINGRYIPAEQGESAERGGKVLGVWN
jgi:hypothetical protein